MSGKHAARSVAWRTRCLLGLALLTTLVSGSVVVDPAAEADTPEGWVAFTRDPTGGSRAESGDEEIYAIRLDGTGVVRLTSNSCIDITANASRDGMWLSWVQKCGTAVDLMMAPIVYDASGQLGIGAVTNVTASLGSRSAERWPQFSPDGTELAFIRKTTGNFDIYRADFAVASSTPVLSNVTRVARLGDDQVEDCCVSWSPDGTELVWASNVNQARQMFNLYRISSDAVEVWDARTNVDNSADGTRDTTVVEQLTSLSYYEGTPAYDDDGTVLFRCNCPNPDVFRLVPETGQRTRLTSFNGLDRTPEGHPGGILYSRTESGTNDEIYAANRDGAGLVNITQHPHSDLDPTWVSVPTAAPG